MEFDPFEPEQPEDTPEKRRNYFEKLEKERREKESSRHNRDKQKKKKTNDKEKAAPPKEETVQTESGRGNAHETSDQRSEREAKKHELAKEYVAARREELSAQLEHTPPNDPEYIAVTADLALMEELGQKLDDPTLEVDPTVESAYQQIMEELDTIVSAEELPVELDTPLTDEAVEPTPDEADNELLVPAKTAGRTKASPSSPAATVPRQQPAARTSTSAPSNGAFGRSSQPRQTATSTHATVGEQPVVTTPEKRTSTASKLVASGAIGAFFLGRKSAEKVRGPIPAPPRPEVARTPSYQPETQLPTVTIKQKEERIRQLAVAQAVEARTTPDQHTASDSQEYGPTQTMEPQRQERPEAFRLEPVHVAAEMSRNSHVETPPRVAPEQRAERAQTIPNVDQLSTPELLQIAHNIKIDGTTARQLFEANRIDHRGLASIVKEALKGGNVKKAFKKHELGAEAKLGRKIEMRHDDPSKIPHFTTDDQPNNRVRTLIDQLQTTSAITDQASSTTATPEPDLASLSQQKAEAAIKKKQLATISVAAVSAIGIGAALAVFFFG